MNRNLQTLTLCLLILMITACQGQTSNAPAEAPKNKTTSNKTQVGTPYLTEVDPYFSESYGLNKGEPPASITRNIIQDVDGHFWFATWKGIMGYDGKSFTNYTDAANLRRYRAFSLLEDKAGIIWFGTIGAGVYRYDPNKRAKGQAGFTNLTIQDGLVHAGIGCISQDRQGNIWFGTQSGISIYDGKSFRNFTMKDGLSDNDINAIVEDEKGKFWIATRGEACTYYGEKFTVLGREDGATFTNVRSLIKDKNGNIWLGGQDGLWRYDGTSFINFETNFIGNIYEDKTGNIWYSRSDVNDTYRMTLCRLDAKTLASGGKKGWKLSKAMDRYLALLKMLLGISGLVMSEAYAVTMGRLLNTLLINIL